MKPPGSLVLLFAVAGLALSQDLQAAITMAVGEPLGTVRNDSYSHAGYGFFLSSGSTLTVNRLGYWDQGGDGLSASHSVYLYQYIGGSNKSYTQIASVLIPSGTTAELDGGYRWMPIPDLVISENGQNGNYYVIMASHGVDAWTGGFGTDNPMSPSFGTISTGALDFGGGVNADEINSSTIRFGGPNFGYAVPEPSSLVLAGLGAIGIAFRRSRPRPTGSTLL